MGFEPNLRSYGILLGFYHIIYGFEDKLTQKLTFVNLIMKAKKSFGQHFLIDEGLAMNIAGSLSKDIGIDQVLEVGPGRGMLTQYLIERGLDLKVVELDRDMIPILNKKFPKLEIIQEDFLKTDLLQMFERKPFLLIGNYPYNISSQIIFKMLEYKNLIPEMVGMFQKEVAERIVSKEGSKKYGVISVLAQLHYEGELIFQVPPTAFDPPPKVNSAVIKMSRRKTPLNLKNEKLFRSLVKSSFGNRRKMIRNCLKSMIPGHEILQDKRFDARPERLSVQEFVDLTNEIEVIQNETNKRIKE